MLNPLLVVACGCIVIALIMYLFYWNRMLAWIIGLVLRLMYWNQGGSSIWIEFKSIHFSLIVGRILLKDFTYHSSNQTVKIAKCQIEWRYWIRRPMMEEDITTSFELDDSKQSRHSHSCRVQLKLQGFQWFMYNRSPSFDNIIDQLLQGSPQRAASYDTEVRRSVSKGSVIPTFRAPSVLKRFMAWLYTQLPNLDPKDLLPLGIDVMKGIIVIGNKSTPNLLLAEFKHAEGIFGVVQSRSKHDLYKQILNLKFQTVLLRYMENKDYCEPMTGTGASLDASMRRNSKCDAAPYTYGTYQAFAKFWRQYWAYVPKHKAEEHSEKARPIRRGKKPNASEEPPGHESDAEYAIEYRILEAPLLDLSYYADVVGEVPPLSEQTEPIGVESFDIGNGGLAPQWGVDIIVRNGFIRYGPWADRQRVELQRAFFPPPYHDVLPTRRLNPGDRRIWTSMRVFIELLDETTLHIPFREPSKNWQWDERSTLHDRRRKREPASIHLLVGDRSSINYSLPMVVGPEGYNPLLEIHLDTVEVTSSLNDIRLVTAESCRIHGEMPSPTKWDAERKWSFGITLRQSAMFLIRDHINMITDLIKDWSSGPPHDRYRFVPMIYRLEFDLHHYTLNLYVNDHNIIDKPLIREENALLTLRGAQWKSEVLVPANRFRPDTTCVPFAFELPNVAVDLCLPRWNTNALHAPKDGNNIGHIGFLRVEASYRYYAEVKEGNVEHLILHFKARQVAFKSLGWAIRRLMVMRENYFGTFTHFSTLWEYLDRRKRGVAPGDPVEAKYRPGQSNPFQAEVTVVAEDSIMIIPAGLPGYETPISDSNRIEHGIGTCVAMFIPQLQLQLRLTEYFMEISLNIEPISCHIKPDFPEQVSRRAFRRPKTDSLLIDGIHIVANRLFGPQPRTATYLCIWEIQLGVVKGILTAWEGQVLDIAGRLFALNYIDAANAPAREYMPPLDPDLTIVKLSLKSLEVTWLADPAALVISLPQGVQVDNNDKPGIFHKKVTSVSLPLANLKLLHSTPSMRGAWLEAACFSIDMDLDIYFAPQGWRANAEAQESFVAEQDGNTGRATRMLSQYERTSNFHQEGFYLPQPMISTVSAPPIPMYSRSSSQAPARPLSGPHRWTRLSHLSESEGEEGLSEAIRDARVAKARSETPVPFLTADDEDLNMSSGDESDDEDLTADSSESDWPENSSVSTGDKVFVLLRMYSHRVRRYGSRHLELPILWDGCPFFILQDPSASLTAASPRSSIRPRLIQRTDPEKYPSRSTIVVRIESQRGLAIDLTPLAVQTLACLADQLASKTPGPELLVDTIIADRISEIPYVSPSNQNLIMDAFISTVHIRLLHHVNLVNDETSMVALSCQWVGCHLSACGATDQLSLKLGLDSVTLSAGPASLKKHLNEKEHCLSVHCTSVTASFADFQVEVAWESGAASFSHSGPEYIIGTALALQDSVRPIPEIVSRHASDRSLIIQRMIHDIIHASSGKPMVDSLSTFQPSYLVQSGISRDLRNDSTIRFLFHLRSCLNFISSKERQGFLSLRNDAQSLSMRDTLSILESRLKALALDGERPSFNDLRTLEETLFPNRKHVASPSQGVVFRALNICLGKTALCIFDGNATSTSDLTISSLTLMFDLRYCGFASNGSQTSLTPGNFPLRKVSIVAAIGDVSLTILPPLLAFAQHVLHVRTHYTERLDLGEDTSSSPKPQSLADPLPSYVTLVLSLGKFGVHAAAQNLIFELCLCGTEVITTALSRNAHQSANSSVKFQDIVLQARSPSVSSTGFDRDTLASFSLNHGALSLILNQEPKSISSLAVVFMLGGIILRVPRSALRLYRFVEEWRADFLPGIEGMAQALLQELRTSSDIPRQAKSPRRPFNYRVNGKVLSIQVSLHVMHGMWLSWEVQDTFAHYKSSSITKRSHIAFGAQVPSQTFTISSNSTDLRNTLTRVQVAIPQITVAGNHDGTCIHILTLIEEFNAKVKPSHWDTLLAVQQKCGQDFNDFLALVQKTQSKRTTAARPTTVVSQGVKYVTDLKVKGFRIGLEGLSSTLFLECSDIYGGIMNVDKIAWQMDLSDLALSLAPRAALDPRHTGFSRNHRSAFVIVDVSVHAQSVNAIRLDQSSDSLQIEISKVHAVMQPSSIGEVGDFIDHLQAEMLERREQRALEMVAFKERTRQLLHTLEAPIRDSPASTSPWFNKLNVDISVRQIGVAFPLTFDQELEIPKSGRGSNAFRAFLVSIKSISFGAQRGETGQAVITNFSFQFVPKFKQSVAADFVGENHTTRNRLMYPEMTAHIRSEATMSSRKVWIVANINGFILDVESSIPDYVFSLIDVYRQGKDRVARLSASLPPIPSILPESSPSQADLRIPNQYTALPTSNVSGSLTFRSGMVRIHSGSQTVSQSRSFTHPSSDFPDGHLSTSGETIRLPVVSVWAEYRATPAIRKLGPSGEPEPSTLVFKSTIHSSENTLKPTLLPFLTELTCHVETRMRKVSGQAVPPSHLLVPPSPSNVVRSDSIADPVSSMRISFSLRIDQSKLELTCQPDVNVIAGLHWESGGFMISISPGARKVTFSGCVGGLTVGLKHGFLSEDCVKLDVHNLVFLVGFSRMESETWESVHSLSVVLDTEVSGAVRFSRLQDVLCFKAVWLDRIPILRSESYVATEVTSKATNPSSQDFTTSILIRAQRIILDVDLGHSISAITLDLTDSVLRTKVTDLGHEASVSVSNVSLVAKGNVSGHANVPRCVFQTTRRRVTSGSGSLDTKSRLELRMTSGSLIATLESEHQRIMHYSAEPVDIEISDDWSMALAGPQAQDRPLLLSFIISGAEIVAATTVGAIPKLMSYVNKFRANLQAQRDGASRESKTFRVTRTPKPDNALSAVTNAMLSSARERFNEETGLSYVIKQRISLRLDSLRLVVFPRTVHDLELARFIALDVEARLDRLVEAETAAVQKDLHLAFSSMTISRFSQLNPSAAIEAAQVDSKLWLTTLFKDASEATIVGLPSMMMHMVSEEKAMDDATLLTKLVVYDFDSKFIRRVGMKDFEDIYITLNVSLYSWLTLLRKNFTRDMDQVRATSDWRTSTTITSPPVISGRRKAPESLQLSTSESSKPTATSPKLNYQQSMSAGIVAGAVKRLNESERAPRSATHDPSPSSTPLLAPTPNRSSSTIPFPFPTATPAATDGASNGPPLKLSGSLVYQPRSRSIERLTMRQLGEATPDVMHPFFMKKSGFNLEDALPQYVNEYATVPLEEIMEVLLRLYSQQLLVEHTRS